MNEAARRAFSPYDILTPARIDRCQLPSLR
jgi:hypothetical protein